MKTKLINFFWKDENDFKDWYNEYSIYVWLFIFLIPIDIFSIIWMCH